MILWQDNIFILNQGPVYRVCFFQEPWPWFNIKMSSYQYRKSHCGDKTILRPSYLHNGISYTGKTASLYWIGALVPANVAARQNDGFQSPRWHWWSTGGSDTSGARFTNGFSIAIHIRWKFRFTLTSILIQWSLQNFVHGTTAVLSWHVQTFVAIWSSATELWQGEVSIEFELRAKNC